MTNDESKLYNELQKLVKKANLRIYRLEKLTGKKETFASKNLADYLSVKGIDALTSNSRISLRKDYTLMQMKAIEKVVNNFLNDTSTVTKVRKYQQEISQKLGKTISLKYAEAFYRASRDYEWIYDYYGSEFWKEIAPLAKTMSEKDWCEMVRQKIDVVKEKNLKMKLIALYYYVKGD